MSRTINDTGTATSHPVSYDSGYSAYSVSGLDNAYTDSDSTTYATINLTRNSNAETIIFYNFSITDIPSGATINSVTCSAKCYISTTNSGRVATRQIRLYSGSTAMGSAHTVSNSTTAFSISAGTWTAAQLANAKIRLYAKRGTSNTTTNYYFRFYGATLTVSYTYQTVAYEVTASSNVSGVTIEPASQEQTQGNSASVILSTNSNIVLLDNNTDVTSSITLTQQSPTYSVETVSGAGYGFNLSNGWYVSANKGINSSTALCRVTFDLPISCDITFTYINYAEATYDFGVFSKVDTALSTTAWDSTSSGGDTTTDAGKEQRRLNTSSYNSSSQQTLTYSNVSSGSHYIDVKFSKDQATAENNDTLQWKVSITPRGTLPSVYTYTITNISADHVLVVNPTSAPTGNKVFVKSNGTWVQASKVYVKVNGAWQESTKVYVKSSGSWV